MSPTAEVIVEYLREVLDVHPNMHMLEAVSTMLSLKEYENIKDISDEQCLTRILSYINKVEFTTDKHKRICDNGVM